MNWQDWLEKWKMKSLKISAGFLEMEWSPADVDRYAAWELYIELLTRIATQPLAEEEGDETTALDSLAELFPLTREIIRAHRGCYELTKIAVVVLNQVLRPFTAKWRRLSLQGVFDEESQCKEFRNQLTELQEKLRRYTRMLGEMAGVEADLTTLE